MIKGERPFDAAKVEEIYAAFANDAKQMPTP
jgi:cytochrome c556